jgi:ectoine hydroxylase-related dioxygenase (phytanoyl-CoA dioxygenase family)
MEIKSQIDGPGYWIKENVLSADECDYLLGALAIHLTTRGRAGARHLMSQPAVAALASDKRLLEIARGALGRKAVPFRATLFQKAVNAKWLVVWHQDKALPLEPFSNAPGWGPWSLKAGITYAHAPTSALSRILALRVHLDASTRDNGPLRIVPESHCKGVMSEEEVLAFAGMRQHVECLVGRGGVLAMRPLLIHSSSKGLSDEPRRVLHIEYANSLALEPGVRLAIA